MVVAPIRGLVRIQFQIRIRIPIPIQFQFSSGLSFSQRFAVGLVYFGLSFALARSGARFGFGFGSTEKEAVRSSLSAGQCTQLDIHYKNGNTRTMTEDKWTCTCTCVSCSQSIHRTFPRTPGPQKPAPIQSTSLESFGV